MPLWYYDKKELKNTPSFRDGIDSEIEARYRREGARFIIDCGTKLGLRYDTCATGVVFFHRFYMFHSFREFHRYVTAACCLFLAGKTEETPKKCKDIIKTTRSMLNDAQFIVFGDDPKEEVMTMERILLQTIKFDLLVEHPYAYLMKFAKMIKSKNESGDKGKVHKLVQMGWTFINDSLCTMLCLQWEPEVIAVSLMYLASRLTKTDITDWQGKPSNFKGKWWEYLVEDINLELLEDVCHQVLDLYSTAPKKRDDTPPPPPPKTPHPSTLGVSTPGNTKRSRSPSIAESHRPHGHSAGPTPTKISRDDKRPPSPSSASKDRDRTHIKQLSRSSSSTSKASRQSSTHSSHASSNPTTPAPPPSQQQVTTATTSYSQTNPYVSSQMYSSSFMSQEGSQSIQSLVGGRPTGTGTYSAPPQYQPNPVATQQTTAATSYTSSYSSQQPPPPPQQPTQSFQHPPPTGAPPAYPQQPVYPQTSQTKYTQPPNYSQQYSYPTGQYSATAAPYPPPTATYTQSYPQNQQPYTQPSYQAPTQYPGYPPPGHNYQNFAPTQSYQAPQSTQPPPQPQGKPPHPPPPQGNSGLGIRITTRQ